LANTINNESLLRDLARPYQRRQREPDEVFRAEASSHNILRISFFALLVAISYYLGTEIGFAFTPNQEPISGFWPPNATLLAALLLAHKKHWWTFFLAVLPVHLFVQLHNGVPFVLAIGWFVGNSAEALLGAALIRSFVKRELLFENLRSVVVFLLFGVIAAPLVTTFLDAAAVVTTHEGAAYWTLWGERLCSNMLAELTLVPVIVLFGLKGFGLIRRVTLTRCAEAALLALMIVLVSILVFGMQQPSHNSIPSLLYLPLPFLLWACVRFGLGGLSASLLSISLISIWNAMHGRGPFFTASTAANLLSVQVLLLVIAVPLLLLTAYIREHRLLEHTLRDAGDKLIASAERNRQDFAGEIREEIGRQLSELSSEVAQLKGALGPPLRRQLDQINDRVFQISLATQNVAEEIYSSQLERQGVAATLRDLCQRTRLEVPPLELDLILEELPEDLSPKVSLCLYRVAEEALRNVVMHSRARKAAVELKVRRQRLVLRIVDDGVGWSPKDPPSAGFGITNMRERTRAVGGTIEIVSRPMRGTSIELSLLLNHTSAPIEIPAKPYSDRTIRADVGDLRERKTPSAS
jgi:two-component system sensor histidine kinase UhpB